MVLFLTHLVDTGETKSHTLASYSSAIRCILQAERIELEDDRYRLWSGHAG